MLNKVIVFLTSGLWHGAAWNFVLWGGYHGALLCAEDIFALNKPCKSRTGRLVRRIITFLLVMIGWVFFRADSITAGFSYLFDMLDFRSYGIHVLPQYILILDVRDYAAFLLAFLLIVAPEVQFLSVNGLDRNQNIQRLQYVGGLFCFCISALKIITGSISPFIYFRF